MQHTGALVGARPRGTIALPQALRLSLLANHFPPLHGLRVLAILGVLQFHVTAIFVTHHVPLDAGFATLSTTVFFGMDLFFVLSGFLIGTLILGTSSATKPRGMLRFYARRSFRIFPLYYVVLTALALLYPLSAPQKINLIYEYTYLTNYRHLVRETVVMIWGWSLCVEEHFYLTVPLLLGGLALARTHRTRIAVLGLLFALGLAVRLAIFFSRTSWTEATYFQSMYIRTHTRFDTLIAGVLVAYVQFHFAPRLREVLARRGPRVALTAVVWVCLGMLLAPKLAGPYFFLYRTFCWGTLTSVMYGAWLLLLLNTDGAGRRFLSHPIFLRTATLGYGVYLIHIPICDDVIVPFARHFVVGQGVSMALVWPASLALLFAISLVGAYALHVLVEKPALALRDRFAP